MYIFNLFLIKYTWVMSILLIKWSSKFMALDDSEDTPGLWNDFICKPHLLKTESINITLKLSAFAIAAWSSKWAYFIAPRTRLDVKLKCAWWTLEIPDTLSRPTSLTKCQVNYLNLSSACVIHNRPADITILLLLQIHFLWTAELCFFWLLLAVGWVGPSPSRKEGTHVTVLVSGALWDSA